MTQPIEILKDKTLYVGRHQEDGRLCVLIAAGEGIDCLLLGKPGSVPATVSRCRISPLSAHCRISLGGGDSLTVSNLKESNYTFVGSLSILDKTITPDDTIMLGTDKYAVNVQTLLGAVGEFLKPKPHPEESRKPATAAAPPTFSLSSLREIWEDFDRQTMAIKKHQRHINLIKGISPIFTLGSGTLVGLTSWLGWAGVVSAISGAGMGLGVGAMVYGFWLSYRDRSLEENARLVESLQENYVCPNPECHHFMGMQPYKVISRNKRCPHCKCIYTTD